MKKRIAHCVYCENKPDGQEHWLNRSLGTFAGNSYLTERICTPCNVFFGGAIDLELVRTGPTGLTRQVLGIEGRKHHEKKNVFEFKASQLEPPIQVMQQKDGEWRSVPFQAVSRNPDGTLRGIPTRHLVVVTNEGEQVLPFPKGWGEAQLRAAAEERGLVGGRLISGHVAPPETIEEFQAAATAIIKSVFGPFELDLFTTDLNAEAEPVVPMILRYTLSDDYARAIAKIAFHYFLWACPALGGDETQFNDVREFIRRGTGDKDDFIGAVDSLVDRTDIPIGQGPDCHVLWARSNGPDVEVFVHLFSQSVGPEFKTFVVTLGARPVSLPKTWSKSHIAAYSDDVPGHSGELREMIRG